MSIVGMPRGTLTEGTVNREEMPKSATDRKMASEQQTTDPG